jgi:hypothetical protein
MHNETAAASLVDRHHGKQRDVQLRQLSPPRHRNHYRRPAGSTFNGALSYVLDGAGNRSSRASTLAALGARAFTYNADDEISGDTFDANGETLTSDGHTYAYNFENRLISKDFGAVTVVTCLAVFGPVET